MPALSKSRVGMMLAMPFAYPLLMQRVWKVFNLWRRPPGVVVIVPFVEVPCLLRNWSSRAIGGSLLLSRKTQMYRVADSMMRR
jgi:hypothetical protein